MSGLIEIGVSDGLGTLRCQKPRWETVQEGDAAT